MPGRTPRGVPEGSLERMLRDIEREVRLTRHLTGRERFADRVMAAMASVPRHVFLGQTLQNFAYDNGPLPIGHGQTISQPYIVALMTDLLEPEPEDVVLEVGTGCGYQTAVLARLVRTVYTVEIIEALSEEASARLAELGYANVFTRVGDGYHGWPEHGPFDGILVTAAAPHVPLPLVEQLKPGARLVIPVGQPYLSQSLVLVEKGTDGTLREEAVLPVAFVPLTGSH